MWDTLLLPCFYPSSVVKEVDKVVKSRPPKNKVDHFVTIGMVSFWPFEDNLVVDRSCGCYVLHECIIA